MTRNRMLPFHLVLRNLLSRAIYLSLGRVLDLDPVHTHPSEIDLYFHSISK